MCFVVSVIVLWWAGRTLPDVLLEICCPSIFCFQTFESLFSNEVSPIFIDALANALDASAGLNGGRLVEDNLIAAANGCDKEVNTIFVVIEACALILSLDAV